MKISTVSMSLNKKLHLFFHIWLTINPSCLTHAVRSQLSEQRGLEQSDGREADRQRTGPSRVLAQDSLLLPFGESKGRPAAGGCK
jgi:hypothetical protein